MKPIFATCITRGTRTCLALACVAALALGGNAFGATEHAAVDEHGAAEPADSHATPVKKKLLPVAPESDAAAATLSAKEMGNKVREALGVSIEPKSLNLVVSSKPPAVSSQASRKLQQARAAAKAAAAAAAHAEPHGGEVHWDYEGENGPAAWGKLKPEFSLCGTGKRQSPINIEEGATLVGPAEPVQFNYSPSDGTVVNNGHTIQVNIQGDNTIMVRGSTYKLLQFHFHTPSEEQVNQKRFAMVAHLVHKNDEGQLAVVAVLLEPGIANPLIDKVWTYMPLDANDQVRMPREILNMNEILPSDQRYYQFMGSLTTPPCTEGVLWMVLKQPMKISKIQFKLFSQLYPHNARPVQPVNGRPVRDAQ